PADKTAAALLQAIEPWLDETRQARQTTLRHGPDGADALDQRGCLVAPLVAQGQLLGFVYADLEGLFGRLHDGDRDLLATLATLAAQAAVALAKLRTQEGLERQVAERTAALEQRAAEPTIINALQQALGGQLSMQGLYDAVALKLAEVLKTAAVSVRLLDRTAGLVHYMSQRIGEQRSPRASVPIGGIAAEVVRTGRTPLINEHLIQPAHRLGSSLPVKVQRPTDSCRGCSCPYA
ncbi:MAG: hypothetical protein RL227_1704, partial [Pseudomonadota bacterium]